MRNQTKRITRYVYISFSVVLCTLQGCGNPFLTLEDFQRDLIIGGLAAAVLFNQSTMGDDPAGAPLPGEDGLNCWDLNGNGVADPEEDVNEDGTIDALDCRGVEGPEGPAGSDGTQDQEGTQGPTGPQGLQGAPGPEFFSIFIDDFFTNRTREQFPVVPVPIDVPVLGTSGFSTVAGENGVIPSAVAFRAAIPNTHTTDKDVTLSLFLYRTGPYDGDCLVLQLDAVRLRDGSGLETYGSTRWIRINVDQIINTKRDDIFLVIDLPINTAAGLDYPSLAAHEFVAFEIQTVDEDGGAYHLLGAELYSSSAGSASIRGAGVFTIQDEVCCFDVPPTPDQSVPDDHLFVWDTDTLHVFEIDSAMTYPVVANIPGGAPVGFEDFGFDDGRHMVFDSFSQRIFVSDHDNNFDVYDTALNELSIDWFSLDKFSLDEPLGIAPLPNGQILISDEESSIGLFRINADLMTVDAQASGSYSLDGAEGIAFDAVNNLVFLADEDDGDIEIFDGTTLEYIDGLTVCGSDGPYWIAVDGSSSRVFFIADYPCPTFFEGSYGIHVLDIGCVPGDLSFNRTILGSGGGEVDCYGTLAVSESTNRLFAIDYCTDTLNVFDTETLEQLISVPIDSDGGKTPLQMISVGHLNTSGLE